MDTCDKVSRYLELNDNTKSFNFKVDPRGEKKARVYLIRKGCMRRHVVPAKISGGMIYAVPSKSNRNLEAGWYTIEVHQNCCPCVKIPVRITDDCGASLASVDEYTDADIACMDCDMSSEATGGSPRVRRDLPTCTPTRAPDTPCPVPPLCPEDVDKEPTRYVPEYKLL